LVKRHVSRLSENLKHGEINQSPKMFVVGLICLFKQSKFLAVENKVIILSGVTTYFLCQTTYNKRTRKKGGNHRSTGIYSDMRSHIF
jgi:hypothetical protein